VHGPPPNGESIYTNAHRKYTHRKIHLLLICLRHLELISDPEVEVTFSLSTKLLKNYATDRRIHSLFQSTLLSNIFGVPSQRYIKQQAVNKNEAQHGTKASPHTNLSHGKAFEDALGIQIVVPDDAFLARILVMHNCFVGVFEYGQVVEPNPVLRNSRPAQEEQCDTLFTRHCMYGTTAFKLCNS